MSKENMGMTIDKAKSVINELKLYVEDLHSYSADDVSETLEFVIKILEQKARYELMSNEKQSLRDKEKEKSIYEEDRNN